MAGGRRGWWPTGLVADGAGGRRGGGPDGERGSTTATRARGATLKRRRTVGTSMPGSVFARDGNVTRRRVTEADYGFVERVHNDPDTRRQAGISLPWTRQRVAAFVEEGDSSQCFLICDGDERVGVVHLLDVDEQARTVELGYLIARGPTGRGTPPPVPASRWPTPSPTSTSPGSGRRFSPGTSPRCASSRNSGSGRRASSGRLGSPPANGSTSTGSACCERSGHRADSCPAGHGTGAVLDVRRPRCPADGPSAALCRLLALELREE